MAKAGHSSRVSHLRITRMRSLSLKSSFRPLFTSPFRFSPSSFFLFLPHIHSSLLPPSLTQTNKPSKGSTDSKRKNTLPRTHHTRSLTSHTLPPLTSRLQSLRPFRTMFDGSFKSRRTINLGGNKQQVDKQKLLKQAQEERRIREAERARLKAAERIQVRKYVSCRMHIHTLFASLVRITCATQANIKMHSALA